MRLNRAFTLVEMLIAMVLTLIMVAAIAEFYAYVGDTVRDGRAMMEISGQMRAAVQRLKSDFDQITSSVVPWADDGAAQGYFEYREGAGADYDANGNDIIDATNDEDADTDGTNDLEQLGVTNLIGDVDDYLAFTIRSNGDAFTGRQATGGGTQVISSQFAEVVWFTSFSDIDDDGKWDLNEPRTLHRRLLLVRPDLGQFGSNFQTSDFAGARQQLYQFTRNNDVSLSLRLGRDASNNPVLQIMANSMTDLVRRENRFGHQPGGGNFPNALLLVPGNSDSPGHPNFATTLTTFTMQGDYKGEDVVLSEVLAFDVKLYDPEAVLKEDAPPATPSNATAALAPHDPGYARAVKEPFNAIGTGAYVDLGYGVTLHGRLTKPPFNMQPAQAQTAIVNAIGKSYYATAPAAPPSYNASQTTTYQNTIGRTYDTWATSYERDGINQDSFTEGSNQIIDESTNGVDDDNANGVDDYRERETVPPYPQPIRGLQVKLRLYEPGTRQMRQATVTADFLAE